MNAQRLFSRLIGCGILMVFAATSGLYGQAPITVTNTNDSGGGSLRDAIVQANNAGTPYIIQFDSAQFNSQMPQTITLTTGPLVVSGQVTISGPGMGALTIDANQASQIFQILAGGSATISDLTLAHGAARAGSGGAITNAGTLALARVQLTGNAAKIQGGAVYNNGTASITDCVLSNNTAFGPFSGDTGIGGGAVANAGTLTITRSTLSFNKTLLDLGGGALYSGGGSVMISGSVVSNNSSTAVTLGGGGGIFVQAGTLTIVNTTVSDNDVFYNGGGIYATNATVTIIGSTISGNMLMAAQHQDSGGYGGGIVSRGGTATIVNSTISGNAGKTDGGGIANLFGNMTITNVTLSGNEAGSGDNLYNQGTLTIQNTISDDNVGGGDCFNFNAPGSGATITTRGVNYNTDGSCGLPAAPSSGPGGLNLGPLQDNGGPTWTHALLPGSVAIDAAGVCLDQNYQLLTTDQRGVTRPQGQACDAGAYEAPPTPSITSGPANPTNSTTATFMFSDTDASATFACSLDGHSPAACTSGVQFTGLGNGPHMFAVTGTTSVGTSGPATYSWTVDAVKPSITIDTPKTNALVPLGASINASYTCDGTGSALTLCAGPVANGAPIDTSTAGPHTFTVNASDAAGNTSTASAPYTVVAPPSVPSITSRPSNLTNSNTATFAFSDTDASATFTCTLDGQSAACTSGVQFTGLGEGLHNFAVTAANIVATSSPATYGWTVDTVKPSITITSPAANASYLLGAVVNAAYTCNGTGSALTSCNGSVANGSAIDTSAIGPHTFTVSASDAAGNTATAPVSYTVVYQFTGFQSPIANPPNQNQNSPGSTVALKWLVKNAASQPVTTLTSVQMSLQDIACNSGAPSGASTSIPATLQNLGGGQYQVNWKTSATYTGCKVLTLDLGDHVAHQALFNFSRSK
jgi:hypothetical protein